MAATRAAAAASVEEGRLRLPEFEWYLGPMYRRYAEILAERARAADGGPVKKKVNYTAPPEDPWLKHTRPRSVHYTFSECFHERPLQEHARMHVTTGRRPTTPRSARAHPPEEEPGRSGERGL